MGMAIYWHCPVCDATAELPSKTLAASVAGLHRHQTMAGHLSSRAWHRREGGYVLIDRDQGELGSVEHFEGMWYAHLKADVGRKIDDGPFERKRDAQAEVEALAHRIVRVLV